MTERAGAYWVSELAGFMWPSHLALAIALVALSGGEPAAARQTAVAASPTANSAFACPAPSGKEPALEIGRVTALNGKAQAVYALDLKAKQGVLIDLDDPNGASSADQGEDDITEEAASAPDASRDRSDTDHEGSSDDADDKKSPALWLCNTKGELVAPGELELFSDDSSDASEGQRLRALAPVDGRYLLVVARQDGPRELLVRSRNIADTSPGGAQKLDFGHPLRGEISKGIGNVYRFEGRPGQWIKLRATGANKFDTRLRLAGRDSRGKWQIIAENDDTNGLDPVIYTSLTRGGQYLVQVVSLGDESGRYELLLNSAGAPPPPPAPTALMADQTIRGSLEDGDDYKLYSIEVTAGKDYRLEASAPYDLVLAQVSPALIRPSGSRGRSSGDTKAYDLNFTVLEDVDQTTEGAERLDFTAQASGKLLVLLRSYGDIDGDDSHEFTVRLEER